MGSNAPHLAIGGQDSGIGPDAGLAASQTLTDHLSACTDHALRVRSSTPIRHIRFGSFASFQPCLHDVRSSPDSGHLRSQGKRRDEFLCPDEDALHWRVDNIATCVWHSMRWFGCSGLSERPMQTTAARSNARCYATSRSTHHNDIAKENA